MQCLACKISLPDGAKFCPECGGKMPGSSSQSDVRDENQQLVHSQVTRVGSAGAESRAVATTAGQSLSQRYELMEEMGRGGFAVVYKARDRKLDRLVAVKRLLRERAVKGEDDQAVQRFLQEATMIASLSHRNIVQIYDRDQDEEGYYIVMELITGGALRQRLKDSGKMKVPEAVGMLRGICQGLGHAHRRNLVHRDIKPANILLGMEAGETVVPKLVDFGLARGAEESGVSLSGYGMGTPAYMAPEQRRNAKGVNHTADIYALGKTLYEMVTGESPENVDPEMIPGVEGLGRIIFKCIKTRPEDRYFSVDELLRELEGLLVAPAKAKGPRTTADAEAVRQRVAEAGYLNSGNSLGMGFARVAGTEVLFSVWETRVRDYEVFAKEKGLKWEKADFEQGPEHPAVNVSWDDAKAFCEWLTEKEQRGGRLGLKEEYRLPTDLEWSAAVGLPKEAGGTVKERDGKIPNVYPWGSQWPPPKGAGNYGSSLKVDDFDKTSPVGSFAGNQYGLYDLGGNVWEWCEDLYDGRNGARVLRGGSWINRNAGILLSSYRGNYAPDYRIDDVGFRVVLVGLCST